MPPSTLRTERHKPWHLYKLNSQQCAVTMTFSFRIGNAGYFFAISACQTGTESTDGLNLPGRRGCGNRFISSKVRYPGLARPGHLRGSQLESGTTTSYCSSRGVEGTAL